MASNSHSLPARETQLSRSHTTLHICSRAPVCSRAKLALDKIFLFTWGLSPGVPMATPGTQWSQWGRWPACRQKTRVLTKRSTRLGQRGVSGGPDVPAGSLGSRSVCRSNWPGRGSSLANLLYWRAFLEECLFWPAAQLEAGTAVPGGRCARLTLALPNLARG